jgi:uncharacterized membrane protein
VEEEFSSQTPWHEALAERVTRFVGRPHYVVVHLVWFVVWVVLNTGIIMAVRRFDSYPYGLLGTLLALEAVLITGFLLISQNREQARERKFAELEYEVNVRCFREIAELKGMLQEVLDKLDRIDAGEARQGKP